MMNTLRAKEVGETKSVQGHDSAVSSCINILLYNVSIRYDRISSG